MRLILASRTYDLTSRALVVAAPGAGGDAAGQGADFVERAGPRAQCTVPVYAMAPDDASLDRALSGGAALVRLPEPTAAALARCATAGVAVILPSGAVDLALANGLPPNRTVPESLLLDVTGPGCSLATMIVGVLRGARLVRTTDVVAARRICDVLAAVLEDGP